MPETSPPSFVEWSSFPFEGELRVKKLEEPVAVEPPRKGESQADCAKCQTPDDAYIWVNENWRVRSMDRPSGLPMVLILESRSHLDLGDLPNMLAAELGVMTVRLERAIRSLDGVARVHVNRWGDGAAHLHLWFMARPYGRLQLRGTFLTLWDEILPSIPEGQWRENLALIAAWLAEFGGEPLAKPPRIDWKAPSSFAQMIQPIDVATETENAETENGVEQEQPPADPPAAPAPAPATVPAAAPTTATPAAAPAAADAVTDATAAPDPAPAQEPAAGSVPAQETAADSGSAPEVAGPQPQAASADRV